MVTNGRIAPGRMANGRIANGLLLNAGIAVFGMAWMAQEGVARPAPGHDVLVRDGGAAARVGVADGESGRSWVVVPLVPRGDGLHEETPRPIASARHWVESPSRVDVLHRSNGSWALVQDANGGGRPVLELLELDERLLDRIADPEQRSAILPRGRLFTEVELHGDRPGELVDEEYFGLFAPRLVEREGHLQVIASSYPVDGSGPAMTWIAPIPAPGPDSAERLEAHCIGTGADARVGKLADEYVCLVRALEGNQTLAEAAPVHVYWSRDLTTWFPGAQRSEAGESGAGEERDDTGAHLALLDYDLIGDLGSLWLAGVVVAGPRTLTRVWRMDATDERWRQQPEEADLPGPSARVLLLASDYGVAVPKLVLPAAEGELRVVPLAVR